MVRARVLAILLSGAAACGCATAAFAHPHVWATVRSEIVFGPDKKIVGIRHAWTFDEFYTAMAVQGLDTDKDGTYSKEELQPLAKVNVESLTEFAYFTFVSQGDDQKPLPLKPPVDYWLDYDKSVVTLHFTLPLETPLDVSAKQVTVDVFDQVLFRGVRFCQGGAGKACGRSSAELRGGSRGAGQGRG